jgi:hypothetical protein
MGRVERQIGAVDHFRGVLAVAMRDRNWRFSPVSSQQVRKMVNTNLESFSPTQLRPISPKQIGGSGLQASCQISVWG